ncbi:DUF5679 domain-containing protein [Pseudobacteriovorax antillogorgiicola]|uniref:DUF5679 domain-containing protein n=1 Tax=Pseudobacteriovorax antillogorgiicola TaxID=1513793 RepID=A0A1Y6B7H5_9BACT|nr:DUF5679 domain-containing protein [Pseudobacteriovorax antillogorgiicola]TCS59427.1 hypothetical protein EDD56_101338 [Pseudobacteriovorax antillogorgiicola]SME88374.1 hypothetical protein SAMN06296036_101147 [Pseudobacteriovorax antillogorgiicola]
MSYPAAYCVKCKAHTNTLNKHSVVLANNSRALRGQCPVCLSENYQFLPAKDNWAFIKSEHGSANGRTLLPTTVAAKKISHGTTWGRWAVYAFFVMSCIAFGYVLSLRF